MLKKISSFFVDKRILILVIMLLLAVLCAVAVPYVEINEDMTRYLPDDSPMKMGTDIMNDVFPEAEVSNSIRVVFDGLTDAQKTALPEKLQTIEHVSSVDYDPAGAEYNKDGHTLYVLHIDCDYRSAEERAVETALESEFSAYHPVWHNDDSSSPQIPLRVYLVIGIVLLAILFTMCGSWLEPFLFLFTIGIAILLNLGSNLLLGTVSSITKSIAAILQLALSMDYSIILMNRYRQERKTVPDKVQAMKHAWSNAFLSVSASSLTTVVGLLMLVFMRFKIGADLGIVLAKGVFLSMVCVLGVLPGLVILCDGLLTKTAKKVLRIPMHWAAAFSYKRRFLLTGLFVVLFAAFYILQANTGIDYTLAKDDAVAELFPKQNTVILLYESQDEDRLAPVLENLAADQSVRVTGYGTTIGRPYSAPELAAVLPVFGDGFTLDPSLLDMLYAQFCSEGKDGKMTIDELFSIMQEHVVNDPTRSRMLPPDTAEKLSSFQPALDAARAQFVSGKYSRLILTTTYPEEGAATTAFLDGLERTVQENLDGNGYLIGNSVMAYEMRKSFDRELLLITLLTALAIYLIVAISFRSLFVPLLLVLLVQCGVYITVTVTGIMSGGMYYLALLMVECILMGATIDYGILFTNYYRESRRSNPIVETLQQAYAGSVHTILTSGLILVLITAAVGRLFEDETVTEICRTISIGSFCVILLILFVLPGVLAACDKLVKRK